MYMLLMTHSGGTRDQGQERITTQILARCAAHVLAPRLDVQVRIFLGSSPDFGRWPTSLLLLDLV